MLARRNDLMCRNQELAGPGIEDVPTGRVCGDRKSEQNRRSEWTLWAAPVPVPVPVGPGA